MSIKTYTNRDATKKGAVVDFWPTHYCDSCASLWAYDCDTDKWTPEPNRKICNDCAGDLKINMVALPYGILPG